MSLHSYALATCFALSVELCCLSAVAAPKAEPADQSADRHFTLRVLPMLKEKCFGCHGNDTANIRGEYTMLTREELLQGGAEAARRYQRWRQRAPL